MHRRAHTVTNTTEHDLMVCFEPWGSGYPLKPGESFEFVVESPEEGEFEIIEEPGVVTLFAWPGCTMTIYQNGEVFLDIPIRVPGTPNGMSTRSFLGMILGRE